MTSTDVAAAQRAIAGFEQCHGRRPAHVISAPGRVNLIGEHTDYNDGFVLPLALPHATVIAAEPLEGATIEAASEGFGKTSIETDAPPTATADGDGWAVYLHGMASLLRQEGHPVAGWRGAIATDIPAGAGLSSSAALEVAAGLASLVAAGADSVDRGLLAEIAAIGTRLENELLGLPSGIMDQLISATAVDGAAMLIDCRTGEGTPVPIPAEAMVVVLDSGTRRQLVDSAFADRRADCARASELLDVPSLRHATMDDLDRLATLGGDDAERLVMRARHVIGENERTVAAAEALRSGELARAGALMDESHASLSGDYAVSSPALDAIVATAGGAPGCIGARMTGGGFAGCAVALVEADAVDAFCADVLDRYEPPTSQPATEPPALYPVRPSTGASAVAG
ncbi:MAG: galactokinase [Actinomycetota bacterium]